MTALDFAPLLVPGLPPPAVKFNGFPKYNFAGGHNDGEQIQGALNRWTRLGDQRVGVRSTVGN